MRGGGAVQSRLGRAAQPEVLGRGRLEIRRGGGEANFVTRCVHSSEAINSTRCIEVLVVETLLCSTFVGVSRSFCLGVGCAVASEPRL